MENLEAIRAQLKTGEILMCKLAKARSNEIELHVFAKHKGTNASRSQILEDNYEYSGEREWAE